MHSSNCYLANIYLVVYESCNTMSTYHLLAVDKNWSIILQISYAAPSSYMFTPFEFQLYED